MLAKLKKVLLSKLVAVSFVISTLMLPVVMAAPASASAWGCSWFGNFTIAGLPTPIYQGNYCVQLGGTGLMVDGVAGNFSSAGNICNWNITAEFFNKYGSWYKTINGPYRSGCNRIGSSSIYVGQRMQEGFMCSTLKTNGKRITSVCHSVFP